MQGRPGWGCGGLESGIPPTAGQAVRRLGWGVADQAVSSLTNFAVSIYVVRTLGATQFGAFSLAYVTYAFAAQRVPRPRHRPADGQVQRHGPPDLAACRRELHRDRRGCGPGRRGLRARSGRST